jgi:hypothetical protein
VPPEACLVAWTVMVTEWPPIGAAGAAAEAEAAPAVAVSSATTAAPTARPVAASARLKRDTATPPCT